MFFTQTNRFAYFAVALLLLSGCMTTAIPEPDNDLPDADFGLNQQLVLDLINEVRAQGCKCGTKTMSPAKPLRWNNRLATAALGHSRYMHDANYFGHDTPQGQTPQDRIDETGYMWLSWGENLGKGFLDEESLVKAWLGSALHCEKLMNPKFREMGMGRVGVYWTQNLAEPLN